MTVEFYDSERKRYKWYMNVSSVRYQRTIYGGRQFKLVINHESERYFDTERYILEGVIEDEICPAVEE